MFYKNIWKKEKFHIFLIISIAIIFHFFCINFFPVNDEFMFPLGAKLIEKGEFEVIKYFFDYNANTLGFSIVIFLFSKVLFFLNFSQIAKVLSISGLVFISFGIINFKNFFRLKNNISILTIIIILNPLIWIFSFRGTPEIFSASLAFFSLSMILLEEKYIKKIIPIFLLSVAIIIKPINAIVIVLILMQFFSSEKKKEAAVKILITIFLSLLLPIIFFAINKVYFDFYIINENYSSFEKLENSFSNFVNIFISYSGFTNIILLPLTLKFLVKDLKKNIFIIILFLFLSLFVSQKYMFGVGELNFGFLTNYISKQLLTFILCFNFFLLYFYFYKALIGTKSRFGDFIKLFIFLTIVYFLILSNFHPAQRYIAVLIPIFLFINHVKYYNKFLSAIVIIIYLAFDSLLFINYYKNSINIKNVITFLNERNITNQTHPGYLGQHALNFFIDFNEEEEIFLKEDFIFDNNKPFYVSENLPKTDEKIIYTSSTGNKIIGARKLYVIKK